jgi:hypothetical protein
MPRTRTLGCLFSEPGYVSIGDPYGVVAPGGAKIGVLGASNVREEAGIKLFPARKCWGGLRARSHRRFVPPLIHAIPYSLTYSVPLFLKRQCDRTLGGLPPGATTPRLPGIDADTWRRQTRSTRTPVRGRDVNAGGQGGRPAPSASRLHRIPTHLLLDSYGI